MDTYTIDTELEHYYGERLAMNNREASRRFYVRATARFRGAELEKYLQQVSGHARVYASLSRMLQSPLRHMETPLFLSSLVLCAAGVVMIVTGEFSMLVAGGTSAGVVGMIECGRKLVAFWQRHGVREAVFRELAESLREG
jgi:hypothetical protein